MSRKTYNTKRASVSGPYSHAVDAGDYVFLAGQTAKNVTGKEDKDLNIGEQTKECFDSLFNVLKSANLSSDDVVKVNVFLTGMKHFSEMNKVYEEYFTEPYPARTCVAVLELPLGADVEIEIIAKRS
ncbi:MAG TPA: Rid family detoxifying hydrolase [Tissierellaceae bacterium]|nr:Rid family detoxifying hydrolase [Tissierellaceae bacterium]